MITCPACHKPIHILKIRDKFICEQCGKHLKSNKSTIFGWWAVIWIFGIGSFIPALFKDAFWLSVIFGLAAGIVVAALLFSVGLKISEDFID